MQPPCAKPRFCVLGCPVPPDHTCNPVYNKYIVQEKGPNTVIANRQAKPGILQVFMIFKISLDKFVFGFLMDVILDVLNMLGLPEAQVSILEKWIHVDSNSMLLSVTQNYVL